MLLYFCNITGMYVMLIQCPVIQHEHFGKSHLLVLMLQYTVLSLFGFSKRAVSAPLAFPDSFQYIFCGLIYC